MPVWSRLSSLAALVLGLGVLTSSMTGPADRPSPPLQGGVEARADAAAKPGKAQTADLPDANSEASLGASAFAGRVHLPQHPAIRGEWSIADRLLLIELARDRAAGFPVDRVPVELGDAGPFLVSIEHFEIVGEDEGVFTGSIEGRPGSLAVLAYTGSAQAGSLHLPAENRAIRLRGSGDGTILVTDLDLSHAPDCGLCRPDSTAPATVAVRESP